MSFLCWPRPVSFQCVHFNATRLPPIEACSGSVSQKHSPKVRGRFPARLHRKPFHFLLESIPSRHSPSGIHPRDFPHEHCPTGLSPTTFYPLQFVCVVLSDFPCPQTKTAVGFRIPTTVSRVVPSRPTRFTGVRTTKWSEGESNSRPQHCERCALPTELSPRFKHPNPGRLRNSMFSIVYPHCPICQGVGSSPFRKFSAYTQDFSKETPSLGHFRGKNSPGTEEHLKKEAVLSVSGLLADFPLVPMEARNKEARRDSAVRVTINRLRMCRWAPLEGSSECERSERSCAFELLADSPFHQRPNGSP